MEVTCENSANLEQETKTTKIITYSLFPLASSHVNAYFSVLICSFFGLYLWSNAITVCLLYSFFLLWWYRHILASLHFNANVHRETQISKKGEKYYQITYPKFKLGEEVVREVALPPMYGNYLIISSGYWLVKDTVNNLTGINIHCLRSLTYQQTRVILLCKN